MKPPKFNIETMNSFIETLSHKFINWLGGSSALLLTITTWLQDFYGIFSAFIFFGIAVFFKWQKGMLERRQANQTILHKQEEHEQTMRFRQELHDKQMEKSNDSLTKNQETT